MEWQLMRYSVAPITITGSGEASGIASSKSSFMSEFIGLTISVNQILMRMVRICKRYLESATHAFGVKYFLLCANLKK